MEYICILFQFIGEKIHHVQVDDAEDNHKLFPIHFTEGLKVSARQEVPTL